MLGAARTVRYTHTQLHDVVAFVCRMWYIIGARKSVEKWRIKMDAICTSADGKQRALIAPSLDRMKMKARRYAPCTLQLFRGSDFNHGEGIKL